MRSVAQAIKYAVDHGAGVINLSFGSTEDSPIMRDAVVYARQRGVLLVAAGGNENKGNDIAPLFPANWSSEVMAVAAVDHANQKAAFSNYGAHVSVSARSKPGQPLPGVERGSRLRDLEWDFFCCPARLGRSRLDPRN